MADTGLLKFLFSVEISNCIIGFKKIYSFPNGYRLILFLSGEKSTSTCQYAKFPHQTLFQVKTVLCEKSTNSADSGTSAFPIDNHLLGFFFLQSTPYFITQNIKIKFTQVFIFHTVNIFHAFIKDILVYYCHSFLLVCVQLLS